MPGYQIVKNYFEDFFNLAFPHSCLGCGGYLAKGEQTLCTYCRMRLPFTDYNLFTENPLKKKFYGKILLNQAFAMLQFTKNGFVQSLMHQLKYDGKREIGELMGELMANWLLKSDTPQKIDLILPVPLHPQKEKKRGYNQAAVFGEALAKAYHTNYAGDLLMRNVATETQTRKSRIERSKNMENVFVIAQNRGNEITGKDIYLVDDVVTTGATCENCLSEIQKYEPKSINVAAIAIA